MKRGIIWVLSFFLVLSTGPVSIAQSSSQHGFDVAHASRMSNKGFHTIVADLTILTEEVNGNKTHKLARLQVSELMGEGSHSMVFLKKSGIDSGNMVRVVTHENTSNRQWKYNSQTARSKMIKKAHTPFMETEFAFEDFSMMEIEKYQHKLLREEMDDDDHIYVVEQKPLDRDSKYYRQVVWFNASKGYRIEKVVFYDLNDQILKTLKLRQFHKYAGKYWRPKLMHMQNHQTGRKTTIQFDNYSFDGEESGSTFSPTNLARLGDKY